VYCKHCDFATIRASVETSNSPGDAESTAFACESLTERSGRLKSPTVKFDAARATNHFGAKRAMLVKNHTIHWAVTCTFALCVFGTQTAMAQKTKNEATMINIEGEDTTTRPKHTNNLINATSPYLLQHAHNPVDWYEWGEEAFAKAKKEDKPIFLSIGYAACHWCHVMEHESFENEEIAEFMNRHFIAIKVDREERPDIDEIYMAYTQARTRSGGWPMSVWLTPDARPFHAGTYFPKERFASILDQISGLWASRRDQLLDAASEASTFLDQWSAGPAPAKGVPPVGQIELSAMTLAQHFDGNYGGIASGANKFPPSMSMDLMLRIYRRTGATNLLYPVKKTLNSMARGGIYDHIGGGICRYSTDPKWLVPHFEKMLYDQALVSAIYLDGYQVTRDEFYREVAEDIFSYVLTDLRSPDGAFFSSRDADSEGLEGKFYVWTVEQVVDVLGEADAAIFNSYYDVTAAGNWEETRGHAQEGPKNILNIRVAPDDFAQVKNIDAKAFRKKLSTWRKKMFDARSKRIAPALDDKVLTDWNGLMIASLAKAGRVLENASYTEAAGKAADFILSTSRRDDGRLLRTYRAGKARLLGNLSDYAFMTEALLNLYEATFDEKWLVEAEKLTDLCVKFHLDAKGGGFFFVASDGEKLVARSKNPQDGAIPSGNSVQAMNLLRLSLLLNKPRYRELAEGIFRAFGEQASRSPGSFERFGCALDFYHDKPKEIAVIGDPNDDATKALLRTVYKRYLPNKVVVGAPDKRDDAKSPLLKGKKRVKGLPTAYVCEGYRCKLPVTTPEELGKLLDAKPYAAVKKEATP
jgi:uncharacterized protein